MHLKQLKLAGFKSFVDPTVVEFPGQLVAVLGPNGCGKSNIIDAVRWVMGESSAKNLRGESMTDVIFNGSSHRKALGQASVELVFDNSLGRLSGPFAQYGEVSVRRLVTRDGESAYFLNGARCRRRDITEIFLGTGAGARGYSIIGQGTISRIIEARPEELRAYLEEAAGVSKYKERRKETLQRIEHTRENLTRVADIREELDKQLQRLERQAKSAERYTLLKEEERLCRAEILALKWQEYINQWQAKQKEVQDFAVLHEQQHSMLTAVNKEKIILNEQLQDANEQSQQVQSSFYQLGTEIARLEEAIQQQDREKKRLEQDRQNLQGDWQTAQTQLNQDKEALEQAQLTTQTCQQNVQQLTLEFQQKEIEWQTAQQEKSAWDELWQTAQSSGDALKRELQITEVNVQHLEQRRNQTITRLEKLNSEQSLISLDDLNQTKSDLENKHLKLHEAQQFDEQQVQQSNTALAQAREQLKQAEEQLHQYQDDFYRLNSELAALNAAQKAAVLATQSDAIEEWSSKPRLMEVLQVEPEWQSVCEMILHDSLHAYVLETFDEVLPQWSDCARQGQSIVTLLTSKQTPATYPRLSDKILGSIPATVHHLDSIYTAQSLDEALSWLPHLLDHESIVTTGGFWLGKGWVKLRKVETQDEEGVLGRQQKIVELDAEVKTLQATIETVRQQRDVFHEQVQEQIKYSELFQLNLNASNEALRVNANALTANEQSMLQAQRLMESMAEEQQELNELLEECAAQHLEHSEKLQQLSLQSQTEQLKQEQLHQEKLAWVERLQRLQKQRDEARSTLHQAELESDREVNRIQQLSDRISREQERLEILQERLEQLAQLCLQSVAPESEFKKQLAEQLAKHSEIETQLTASREQVSQIRIGLEDLEKKAMQQDLDVRRVQEQISQARIQEEALSVRASAVQESLTELGLNAEALLIHLPPDVTQSQREDELLALNEKIKRLGPINLAAIEEYSTEQQRKLYLDEQFKDLSEALSTLETAITKMDNETRLRLETTFDEVNTSFKALFPRLFGGGKAQLELTCDNLLEAGIVVMAQPPGKRNSTIHLLSGGEKAMTAVALVFAIFQLNPSPFCMLDEVDAPLDDVNVGRFCDLVKEMSQFVQFLFITHNKVTMELANHLIGVTMREPGVSRLVTVDVKQALTTE